MLIARREALRRAGVLAGLIGAMPWARAARPAPAWRGRVTHVSDGDSLWVRPEGGDAKPVEIRLADIDAPEICQPWGPEARDALRERVNGQVVSVHPVGRDGFGRLLARVQVAGQDLGRQLVVDGHAWSQRTRWDRGPLVKEESVARALNRGLFATPRAQMPRDFRKTQGPCPAR